MATPQVNDGWEYWFWTDDDVERLVRESYPRYAHWFHNFHGYAYWIQQADSWKYTCSLPILHSLYHTTCLCFFPSTSLPGTKATNDICIGLVVTALRAPLRRTARVRCLGVQVHGPSPVRRFLRRLGRPGRRGVVTGWMLETLDVH